jgi:hypothetical protein
VVRVGVLRAAIDATQAIRHARAADADTTVSLSDEQIEALDELSRHPALGAMMDALDERYVLSIEACGVPEMVSQDLICAISFWYCGGKPVRPSRPEPTGRSSLRWPTASPEPSGRACSCRRPAPCCAGTPIW